MPVKKFGVGAIVATSCAAAAIVAAPVAVADDCDPTATVCENVQGNTGINASPPASATDEQYPYDNEWYFNPSGGGTPLQNNPPPASGGGGAAGGGGGGHR
jgi:hypothetical protein